MPDGRIRERERGGGAPHLHFSSRSCETIIVVIRRIYVFCEEFRKKKKRFFPYLIGLKRNFGIAESQTKKKKKK